MAEIGVQRDRDDVVIERTGFRLSWGAIFAGFVVATALQMVLSTLGVAIGFAAFDPGRGDSASELGIGVAVWFALTAVISLFVGGLTTGRLAGVLTRGDGRLHGVVMWSLSTLLALYFASIGANRILGGVFSLVTSATSAAAGAVGQMGAAAVGQTGNIDFGTLQREIETTLQQTGDPALQPEALEQSAQDAAGQATAPGSNQQLARDLTDRIRATAGQVNRQDLINVITARTGMSEAEAEQVATRVESAASSAGAQVSSAAGEVSEQAGQAAGTAANYTSKAAWAALLVMGLSLLAAVFGAGRTAPD